MNINGIGHGHDRAQDANELRSAHRPPKDNPLKHPPKIPTSEDRGEDQYENKPAGEIEDEGYGSELKKGVLRLLEAGHFKGVADVRLRINFFDELSAGATRSAIPIAQQHANQLADNVNAKIDEMIGSMEVDEETQASIDELRSQFNSEIQSAIGQFASEDTLDREALTGSIKTAFGNFTEQLKALFGENAPEPAPELQVELDVTSDEPAIIPETEIPEAEIPVPEEGAISDPQVEVDVIPGDVEETPPPVSEAPAIEETAPEAEAQVTDPDVQVDIPENEPIFNIDDAVAEVIAVFNEALDQLASSIESATQLPDPSPPSGKGGAYQKFLDIYNQMRGLVTPLEDPVTESIDTIT